MPYDMGERIGAAVTGLFIMVLMVAGIFWNVMSGENSKTYFSECSILFASTMCVIVAIITIVAMELYRRVRKRPKRQESLDEGSIELLPEEGIDVKGQM